MLFSELEEFKDILIRVSTTSSTNEDNIRYKEFRYSLLRNPELKPFIPKFIETTRQVIDFWDYISSTPSYSARRQVICNELEPLFQKLEQPLLYPSDDSITSAINTLSNEQVSLEWKKALERRNNDPEGAITSARSLLEAVCKHILDCTYITYTEKADLPDLYKLVSNELNLAPNNHCVDIFKQILGGCNSVVLGLGSLRNKLSDAHGKPRLHVKASSRHAEFAVNLAGSVSAFLIQTHEYHLSKQSIDTSETIGETSDLKMLSE